MPLYECMLACYDPGLVWCGEGEVPGGGKGGFVKRKAIVSNCMAQPHTVFKRYMGGCLSHLFQELLADEFSPLDAELDLAAGVTQVGCVQHQLQQHICVPPACQIGLLGVALAECIQQPHMLGHVCCQDCIHNQAAGLQASTETAEHALCKTKRDLLGLLSECYAA